jgi:ribosomal RNA-processing protein 36
MSKVSFGALAKAQDALSKSTDRKRKRGEDTSKSQDDKLEVLRERLRQIKAEKLANGEAQPSRESKTAEKSKSKRQDREQVEGGDDNSDSDAAPHARSSKHAPAVQSSKRMVSRKRQVVDVKKPVFRDPRFENIGGPKPDENTLSKRYSFLNDYKASEIAELKKAIKKSRNGDEKEQMRKQLESMESQMKTQQRKDEQQAVVREHKKKEKELIKDGKTPFYLKKCMLLAILKLLRTATDIPCSRTKEACPDRPLPEHERQAARQDHRAPPQEGRSQGAEKHARGATNCMSSQVPAHAAGSGRDKQGCRQTSTLLYHTYTRASRMLLVNSELTCTAHGGLTFCACRTPRNYCATPNVDRFTNPHRFWGVFRSSHHRMCQETGCQIPEQRQNEMAFAQFDAHWVN